MTVKKELHSLVDELGDEGAMEALVLLRRLARGNRALRRAAKAPLGERMGARAVSGRAFFSELPRDLPTLAAEQGVQPVANFESLLGDFWPEDETADQFIAAVREWSREGGHA